MKMLKLRFKLQKNHTSKTSEEQKKVKLHTCALEHAIVQKINKNPKTYSKSKKTKKNISFLKSISNFKISYNQIPSM